MFYKYLLRYVLIGVVVWVTFSSNSNVFAAEILFQEAPRTNPSDMATHIDVSVDPQSRRFNVVEGVIKIEGDVEGVSVQVENGKSILPIWPTPPNYDQVTRSIRFTGGVPNGFSSEGLLFSLNISSSLSRNIKLSYSDGAVYLDDGKGTKDSVKSDPFTTWVGPVTGSSPQDNKTTPGTFVYVIIVLIAVVVLGVFIYGLRNKGKKY